MTVAIRILRDVDGVTIDTTDDVRDDRVYEYTTVKRLQPGRIEGIWVNGTEAVI